MNRLALILTIFAVSVLCLRADEKSDSPLRWLSSLNLIEMPSASAPVVCVPSGASAPKGKQRHVWYEIGFLEQDDDKICRVWLTNFEQREISRHSWQNYGIAPEHTVRKLTALEAAKLWCEWMDTESPDQHRMRVGSPMKEFAGLLVLASAFQQRGETEAANLLERRAMSLPRNSGADWPRNRDFNRDLKEHLADQLLNSVKTDFGNVKISRTQLAQRLTQILRHFPDTRATSEASWLDKSLKVVLVEESLANNYKLIDEYLARLPLEERIANLIQQLPDQTGRQWCIPGRCNIFRNSLEDSLFQTTSTHQVKSATTPASKLLEIGMAAVPQLLAAIDDHRPTRAVGFDKSCWQHSTVLDVGDCAIQILQLVSGRSFDEAGLSRDPDIAKAEIKRNAQAWWQETANFGKP